MEQRQKTDTKVVFEADLSDSLANAIRRYVNEVPTYAVDEVEIFKNDSASYDETVAHRIGLIPLKKDKALAKMKDIHLKLSTKKEGPVLSGEFSGNIEVVYENMPITLLEKGQEMEVLAKVTEGKGLEHAKFSPGLIFYKNMTEVDTGNKASDIHKILSTLSRGEYVPSKMENNKTYTLDVSDACEDELEGLGVEMRESPQLVIHIDSFGQMSPQDLFVEAIGALKSDLQDVAKAISKAK